MKGVGNFRAYHGTNGELNKQVSFSSGSPSSSRRMAQIAEKGNGNMGSSSSESQSLENSDGTNSHYLPSFPNDSLDDSSFHSLKRARKVMDTCFPLQLHLKIR